MASGTRSGIQSEIIPQHLNDRPVTKYLRCVKEEVCASGTEVWFDLGIELLEQKDVAALNMIKSDATKSLSERCSEMFKLWRERQTDASWRRLIIAMRKIRMDNLATDVEKSLARWEVARVDQQLLQEGRQVLQTQSLISHDQLRAEFGRMLIAIRSILSKSPNKEDNLEACKELCIYLKASDSARVLLFSPEKCAEIDSCKDFRQLFRILNQHLSWDELSILVQIIDICDSDEAEKEFKNYKKKMAVSKALEIISSTKSNPPPGFEKFCVIIDKPYKKLTVKEYEEIKKFIFENLDTQRYVTDEYIRVLFDSLYLEWHVTTQATLHMIKKANEQKAFFKKSLFVLMQIGRKVIIDIHTKQRSAERTHLTDELRMTLEIADTTFPVTIKDGNTKKNYTVIVHVKWNVAQVKKEIAHVSKSELLPNQFQLVFAGTQLEDHMTLNEIGVQNTSILHCVHATNIKIQTSTPTSPVLKDVNLSAAEPTSPVGNTGQKIQFYVHCKNPCNGMAPGKIRVRCAVCKATSFVLTQGPCNWKDVLTPRQIRGHCNNDKCKGDVAEFYFKCAMHQTSDEDTSVPLHMIRSNNVGVECITCADVTEIVVVFDCDVGHSMCIVCFITYIKDALNHRNFKRHSDIGYTIQCPNGCADSEVKEIHHFRIIGEKEYERYHRFGAEECVLQMGGIFCPAVNCGAGIIPEPGQKGIECTECKFMFCSGCRNAYHTGNCATGEVQQALQGENSDRFNQNAEHASWVVASKRYVRQISKACPNCGAAIEKTEGCNHMTCSHCKFEFCWLCLIKWCTNCQDKHWFL